MRAKWSAYACAGVIGSFRYAKCFTALTSSRRSRLANLPHFRLKNVVNIKAWISLRGGRTWLKRQGRQRAADEIVSSSLWSSSCSSWSWACRLYRTDPARSRPSIVHIEVAIWCMLSSYVAWLPRCGVALALTDQCVCRLLICARSVFMLRFMMLGSNINKKYQNTSLLLTEQVCAV